MMYRTILFTLSVVALLVAQAGIAQATVLTFTDPDDFDPGGGVNYGANQDIQALPGGINYGSNKGVADDTPEFVTTGPSGATPNVVLTWGPDVANVLEWHSASTWVAPLGAPGVLQLDVDASSQSSFPADPTVDFSVPAGVRVRVNSVTIGNASDQHIDPHNPGDPSHEPAYDWTVNLIRLSDNATVFSYTTTACGVATQGSGCGEVVNIDYTGDPGLSYRLLFDDGGDDSLPFGGHDGRIGNTPRGGLDNLSFSQIPEPSSLALVALCGLGLIATRGRWSL